MAFGSAALAYGTRKVGGVTQIYRTTTASAKSVAGKFRTMVANNWSQQAQRPITQEEVDIPYQAMEDIEAERYAQEVEENYRYDDMTKYTEKPYIYTLLEIKTFCD